MKKHGEFKIKSNIDVTDLGDVIELIVSYVIRKNSDGEIRYTPYFEETGLDIAILRYLIEGIEIESNDNLLDIINNVSEIHDLINEFKYNKSNVLYKRSVSFIYKNVHNIVEFEKQKMTHEYKEIKDKLIEIMNKEKQLNELSLKLVQNQNTLLKQQIKQNDYNEQVMEQMTPEETANLNRLLLDGKFDMDHIMDMAMDKYLNSEIRKNNEKSIHDAHSNKVKDLQKYKNIYEARNVLADK